ncbi:conserved hypothetical protein [Leishmania braziliensis MHOM/BR/75/M2904]|uniref:Uncharacterized protein n=2 Tax=Leishmania braziliensis TaxID=5660 RepID=A4HCR5_LEIBR|nr:conserved hypothetical protein [Leishmania braziliensis MHOM/BR/75/M2904]KAI5688479.1 hypothetical protein MNV84_03948 [Leishmania braziliensis]CAJ2473166.1 unnamed protein product [Leishmania braziliensis]CAJ2473664.1 unnamed protein product [Leishmania braziliensis]CAM36561.1 conserved hypothetical protein [Leishmania braziliensis MHOM/BR/75/M2904]SYZ66032.1 hypothetical_protein [Leishmania braziliensis MHOM/BR/75/M2904]
MPMNKPAFTTNEVRVKRLQENYDEGLLRERMPTAEREQRDLQCLCVSRDKLMFLFQNAMEDYSRSVKNQKVKEYNEMCMRSTSLPSKDCGLRFRLPFL